MTGWVPVEGELVLWPGHDGEWVVESFEDDMTVWVHRSDVAMVTRVARPVPGMVDLVGPRLEPERSELVDVRELRPLAADAPPVAEWDFCRWEGRHVPVDHVCVGDSRVPCIQRGDDGQVCGACPGCIAAQSAYLAQQRVELP